MTKHVSVLAAFLIVATFAANAAQFELHPLRLTLTSSTPNDAFRLTNIGDSSVRVHVAIMKWEQVDGEERLTSTRDILANPPLFQVSAHSQQTIRVGFPKIQQTASEQTYRVLFQEVPDTKSGDHQVSTLLNLSVPVFVPPQNPKPDSLSFDLKRAKPGQTQLLVTNNSNQHAKITKIVIKGPSGKILEESASLYVLAGATQPWLLKTEVKSWPASLHISVETDESPVEADLHVATP